MTDTGMFNTFWPKTSSGGLQIFRLSAATNLCAASGMETRQGQDRETGLGAKHDSPTRQGDAQDISRIQTGDSA